MTDNSHRGAVLCYVASWLTSWLITLATLLLLLIIPSSTLISDANAIGIASVAPDSVVVAPPDSGKAVSVKEKVIPSPLPMYPSATIGGHVDFTNLPWLSMLIASGLAALGAGVWTIIEFGDGRIEKHAMFFKMFVNVVVGSFAGVMVYALMSWWRAEIWQTFLSCCGSGLAGRVIVDKIRDWASGKLTSKGGL